MSQSPERKIDFEQFKSISRAITSYRDLNFLVNHLVEHICRAFAVRGSCILLYDDHEQALFRVASHGLSEAYLSKGPLPLDEVSSRLARGESVFIEDMQSDDRVLYPEAAREEGLISMLSIPVRYRTAFLGIIRVYHDQPWSLHGSDLDSFFLLGEQLGLVVENNGLKNFLEQVRTAICCLPRRMREGL